MLDFPGQKLPDRRSGQVPARWTQRPAGFEPERPEDKMMNTWADKPMGKTYSGEEIENLFRH